MVCDKSRVLVTGGAGFIGSHLVDRLLKEGFDVTVIDNLETGRLENLAHHQENKDFNFIEGDIRESNLVKKTVKDMDAIFHEAALVSVDLSMRNPLLTNDINVSGTLNVLQASLDSNIERFVYASSAAVYGSTSSAQKSEDMIPRPTSPYGLSKLTAENYVQLFHEIYGIETVSLRYFNVYGPRQSFDVQSAYGSVIPIFTNRLLRNMSPIIYGDGEQTRDFVYIEDVIEGNIKALKNRNVAGEVFNIGTGKRTTVNQVAEILKDIMNKKGVENIYANPRPGEVRHGYADIGKPNRILNYNPKFLIKEGLTRLVNWYISKRVTLGEGKVVFREEGGL